MKVHVSAGYDTAVHTGVHLLLLNNLGSEKMVQAQQG